jgi:ribosomal protein S18 acetylase RimI-like enzyme
VPSLAWVPGPSPLQLTSQQVSDVIDMFWHETGEVYAEASLRHLPVPEWNANLLLVDLEQKEPRQVLGVTWAVPFKDNIVRMAAIVISAPFQNQGWGGRAWDIFRREAYQHGFRFVQLEVKADNIDAQRFYQARGLTVQQRLEGYYQSGLGYMMRGPLAIPE